MLTFGTHKVCFNWNSSASHSESLGVMANEEVQEEEREVLSSIYDSDECFTQQNETTFTYRVGEPGQPKSFLIEVSWGASYPDELPTISLDAFYNKHINSESKEAILTAIKKEADVLLGSPMTYSLFEYAKENAEDLVTVTEAQPHEEPSSAARLSEVKPKKEKKEVLSKQAKRRMADRTNAQGELPRGWNWVDIVKLSKTGGVT